jgi:hypothetical protein
MVRTNIVTRVFEAGGDASMDRTSVAYYPYSELHGYPRTGSLQRMGRAGHGYHLCVAGGGSWMRMAHVRLAGHALKAQVYKMQRNWWWDGDLDGRRPITSVRRAWNCGRNSTW